MDIDDRDMVGMTSLRKIFRAFGLRRCAAAVVLAAVLAVVAVTGCSKEDTPAGSRIGEAVLVRLPGVSLASPVEVTPGAPGAATYSATTRGDDPRSDSHGFGAFAEDGNAVSDSSDGLFSVTLGALPAEGAGPDRGTAGSAGGSASPATRAVAELSNVWVFQFDASGTAVRCEKVDALAAGDPLEVVLSSGEDYTLGVVAGGPASGLSTSNIPDLTAFREGLLFTSSVASFGEVPYAGTLSGVRVLANGQVQVGGPGTDVPAITLRRCMAQVTIDLTYSVAEYALDGVELYSVPVGAAFAPDRAAAEFPLGTDASFGYRDNTAAGLAPHATNGGRYTWYIGQNRRGSGTGIAKVQDKNASKAPAYATYARVRTHNTTVEDAPLCYDIYLGEDMLSDFNVTANHVYSYTARITGSAESHYSLLDTDGRVSGKKPQHIEDATVTPAGDIPGEGKPYSLTLTGVLPAAGVEVCARVDGQTEPLVSGKVTASGTPVTLDIPANTTSGVRTVTFEYLWNGTWTQFEETSRTQAEFVPAVGSLYGGGVVYWVSGSDFRVVALDESQKAWAASTSYALGEGAQSQSDRNGAAIMTLARQYSDNKTGSASGDFFTDFPAFDYCYNKTPVGTWYLPSKQELTDLYAAKGSVESVITANGGTAFSAGVYWSATESSSFNSATAWFMNFSTGYTVYDYKSSSSKYVRCVRSK